jgi:hypothetical protein
MGITWPNNTKAIIDSIRQAIGRPVIFNTIVLNTCTASGCSLNPITGDSTNPFCTVCSGEYYFETYSGVSISGHITHYPQDKLQWYPGGQQFDGDVRIQIEYTESNLAVIANTDHLIADGKVFEIKKDTPRGFQPLNRLILACIERDKVV